MERRTSRTTWTMLLAFLLVWLAGDVFAGNQPNWGTAPVAPRPVVQPRQVQPRAPGRNTPTIRNMNQRTRAISWEGLWKLALEETTRKHPIRVAGSVADKSVCRVAGGADIVFGPSRAGNANELGIRQLLVDFTRSLASRRYGDATRLLGLFQDRLLCLNTESVQALDMAFASYLQMAGAHLKPQERDMAFRGAFNPALLVFDQIQYTGRSWTLPILYGQRTEIRSAMAGFDGKNMGLWFFDYRTGSLIRRTFDATDHRFLDGLLDAIQRPGRFGNGACSILEMAATGFNCGGVPGLGDGGGGGGGAAAPSGSGMLGCMTQAALASGMHGQMICMVRAAGGGNQVPDATPTLQINGGVLDQACVMSEDSDSGAPAWLGNYEDGDPTQNAPKHQESPSAWNLFSQAYDSADGFLAGISAGIDAVMNASDSSSASSSSSSASSASSSSSGGLKPGTDLDSLMYDWDVGDQGDTSAKLKWWPEGSSQRTVDGGGGGCGDSTNAVNRVSALFRCSGAGGGGAAAVSGPSGGPAGTGPRGMPAPGGAGASGGGMSGAGVCSMQSGGTVRVRLLGKQCQSMMVGPDQECGGGAAPPEVIQSVRRSIFSPNRPMTGARDPRPTQGRTAASPAGNLNRGFQSPPLQLNNGGR